MYQNNCTAEYHAISKFHDDGDDTSFCNYLTTDALPTAAIGLKITCY